MLRLFKKQEPTPQKPARYSDLFETMLYQAPDGATKGTLPTVYAFRVKNPAWSPDPRPDFALLESDEEIQEWQSVMAGPVSLNDEGLITDAPLLHWNEVPSLLTSDTEIIATYFPVKDGEGWPPLALQAHPFGAKLDEKPARDRYYFQQDKVIAVL